MSVKARQHIEREIAKRVILELLKVGFWISVYNGEEEGPRRRLAPLLVGELMATDVDCLMVYEKEKGGPVFGWVRLIYGNDGWDVINDYTTSLEGWIGEGTPVEKEISKWED